MKEREVLQVRINKNETTITAFLSGDIDHHSAKPIREEIDNEIDEFKPSLLVLDFGEVTFMDSSGIGLVMGRFRKMQTYGGEIQIANTPLYIAKVMRISGIEKLAKITNKGENNESIK